MARRSSGVSCSTSCKGHEGAPSWPRGFKRIRHYGLLSAATKTERLTKARAALAMPAANAQAREDAAAFIQRVAGIDVACCPHCRLGHWRTIEVLQPATHSRHGDAAQCRGPP